MISPTLRLDFTTASLDPRVSFARVTGALNPATFVNSSGVITAATNNQPRFDYDPITLACRGLLIEESRANLLKYSDDFADASWTKTRATISSNATTSPDGTNNADKLVANTDNLSHFVSQVVSPTTTVPYTATVYLKSAELTSATIRLAPSASWTGSVRPQININLTNGTTNSPSASVSASSVTNAGNGWWRLSITSTPTAAGSVSIEIYPGTINAYAGNNTDGIYIWGVQIEAGAFPTSYIPTTSAALTRNADVATITGANFSDWWASSQGGVTANFRPSTVSGVRPIIQYDDGTANEIIALRGNTTNPELYIVDNGSVQAQIDAGTIAVNTDYTLTGWWQTNDCRAKIGSSAPVIDNTATIPTVTQARIGSDGTNYLNGHIASISYYDRFTSQIYNRRKNKVIFSLM